MFDFFKEFWKDEFENEENRDWNELKKTGRVIETIEEKDGFKTITKTYISFDGKDKIQSVESFPIIDDKKEKLKQIDKDIKLAVEKENYEKAAELKKEKENLLNK